ncbi:rod shape-determining protein RodA [Clostridium polynesiense]|uniref:rod shape-determining protein RodA n=1 Tax=Clostridium polynesiense TaxID=1325933 RepID=UPI00058DA3D5|nr:rod shape-determining protein RodA [Clostridium polynesiense]
MFKKFKIDSKLLREMDWMILITSILILLYGVVNIYISSSKDGGYYAKLQLIWMVLGLIVVYFILLVDYSVVKNYVGLIYWASIILLFSTIFIGSVVKGARGWIALGNRAIQPAEFAKVGMMLMLAKKIDDMEGNINDFKNLATLIGYAALPMILIVIQPDMGMTMVSFFIALGILFVAGLNYKVILGGFVSLFFSVLMVWNSPIMPDYWKRRLTSFIHPEGDELDSTLQLLQSQIGIGSGGFFGTGAPFRESANTSYVSQFVPESHTDFIFSILAENWGYIGAVLLLVLYGILVYRIIQAARNSKDLFGSLICVGVASTFLFSILQNIGMTIGIMPITGITLPLVSYGGSSVLTVFISIGMVLNISMRKKKIIF